MNRDFRDYLDDMLDYAEKARGFAGSLTWDQFAADEKTRFAVTRAIEIVGEAARHVPSEIRERFPSIAWARIIGMRNILAHDYVGTNPRVIFDTVTLFIPELIDQLNRVMDDLAKT